MKIHKKRELRNIATDHLADIDYNVFMNVYRKYTSEPYSFLTIDTTLPVNNPLRFRENILEFIMKMTLTDKLKILDNKIKVNQTQYDVDREAAKLSALSSKEMDK